jgi:hypothetical protein
MIVNVKESRVAPETDALLSAHIRSVTIGAEALRTADPSSPWGRDDNQRPLVLAGSKSRTTWAIANETMGWAYEIPIGYTPGPVEFRAELRCQVSGINWGAIDGAIQAETRNITLIAPLEITAAAVPTVLTAEPAPELERELAEKLRPQSVSLSTADGL